MAEVEIGGAKITGGKLFWALPIIGALGSGAWGGFTLYQEFLDLREATASYVSPDLSHIDNHMTMVEGKLALVESEFEALKEVDAATGAVIREQINSVKAIAATLQTDLHDLRMDLNQDVAELNNHIEVTADKLNANLDKQEANLEKQEQRNRQSVEDVNKTSSDNVTIVRGLIPSSEERRDKMVDRLDTKIAETQAMMDKLSKENRQLIENMLKENNELIEQLKKDLDTKIRLALENPLSGMSK